MRKSILACLSLISLAIAGCSNKEPEVMGTGAEAGIGPGGVGAGVDVGGTGAGVNVGPGGVGAGVGTDEPQPIDAPPPPDDAEPVDVDPGDGS